MTLQNVLLVVALLAVLLVMHHVFVKQTATGSKAETSSALDAATVARAKDIVAKFQAKVAAQAAASPTTPAAVTTT